MTTIATTASETPTGRHARRTFGLSARLIMLTVLFMMVAEILVYLPAVSSFRRSWVSDRMMGAQMVALALSAVPEGSLSTEIEAKLLAGMKGAQAIGIRGSQTRWLLAGGGDAPPVAARSIDLRSPSWFGPMRGVLRTLFLPSQGLIRVVGAGPVGVPGGDWVELVLDERPLRDETLAFTKTFLAVSLIVSGVTSALLYLALHLLVVRPVQRLSANIAEFAKNPEDAARIILPSRRSDEIGAAEKALSRMQSALARELRQKRRLAELGLAVSKINHELRNMLTTAQLLGDRLDGIEDPAVKRIAPRLVKTLDRAIEYCAATLSYGRASERIPDRRLVPLKPIILDQLDLTGLSDGHDVAVLVDIAEDLTIDCDAEQLARVILNLMRNSVEALGQAKTPDATIDVSARRQNGDVLIRVADNGPGIPDRVRARLFSAFQASERSGGTGLGLPVAEELVKLQGGTISLESGGLGASFLIIVPDRRPG